MDFSLVSGGYIGVDIFLVISGFLISRLLLDEFEKTGAISLRQFYARRIRRLLPISSFVLLVTALLGLIILQPTRINNLGDDIWAAGLFSANIVFASRGADYLNSDLPPSQYHSGPVGSRLLCIHHGRITDSTPEPGNCVAVHC